MHTRNHLQVQTANMKNKPESKNCGLTTVWWLTWMTSSPAWIFLQRSARDWWIDREAESLNAAPFHCHDRAYCDTNTSLFILHDKWMSSEAEIYTSEHKDACTYSFCRPGDYMQTVVRWLDIHALWEDNRNINYYISKQTLTQGSFYTMHLGSATQPFAGQTGVIAYLQILAFVLICL